MLYGPVHDELPRVSSLCGACKLACPVMIDIPELLVRLRVAARERQPWAKRVMMRGWAWAMRNPWVYRAAQRLLPRFLADDGQGWVTHGPGPLGDWTAQRDLRRPAARSFRRVWAEGLRDEQ